MTTTTTRAPTAGLVMSLIVTLTACSGSAPGGSSPSEAATEAATPTAQGTPSPLGRLEGDLEPGTHILDPVALDQLGTGPGPTQLPQIEITVPEGWYNGGGWVVRKGSGSPPSLRVAVMFWDVDKVYPTPCDGQRSRWSTRDPHGQGAAGPGSFARARDCAACPTAIGSRRR